MHRAGGRQGGGAVSKHRDSLEESLEGQPRLAAANGKHLRRLLDESAELLRALQRARRHIAEERGEEMVAPADVLKVIDAAIAKAEGR